MAVLLPRGAFLTEDRPIFTQETAEPLGVSPPKAVDSFLIEGDVQDMIGLVVGKMAFQKVETSVDVGDQSGSAGDQEHGPDTPGGESLNPIGQFVLDVVGGDHGTFPLGTGTILDTAENSSLALPQFVEDIGIHSKASVAWNSEDM